MRRNPILMAARVAVFLLAAFVLNFPLISTLLTSFKSDAEISSNPSLSIEAPTLANYLKIGEISDRFDITHYLWNSVVAAGLGSLLAAVLAFPAA